MRGLHRDSVLHQRRAGEFLTSIEAALGVRPHETTADRKVSLLTGRCFGSCSLAPAAIVDGDVHARVDVPEFVKRLTAL